MPLFSNINKKGSSKKLKRYNEATAPGHGPVLDLLYVFI